MTLTLTVDSGLAFRVLNIVIISMCLLTTQVVFYRVFIF